jgi:hypothetical protein
MHNKKNEIRNTHNKKNKIRNMHNKNKILSSSLNTCYKYSNVKYLHLLVGTLLIVKLAIDLICV